MEQWTGCGGVWAQSEFVLTVRQKKKRRTYGCRRWFCKSELAAKFGSDTVAQQIVDAKEADEEASKSQVRANPDLHGLDTPDSWFKLFGLWINFSLETKGTTPMSNISWWQSVWCGFFDHEGFIIQRSQKRCSMCNFIPRFPIPTFHPQTFCWWGDTAVSNLGQGGHRRYNGSRDRPALPSCGPGWGRQRLKGKGPKKEKG